LGWASCVTNGLSHWVSSRLTWGPRLPDGPPIKQRRRFGPNPFLFAHSGLRNRAVSPKPAQGRLFTVRAPSFVTGPRPSLVLKQLSQTRPLARTLSLPLRPGFHALAANTYAIRATRPGLCASGSSLPAAPKRSGSLCQAVPAYPVRQLARGHVPWCSSPAPIRSWPLPCRIGRTRSGDQSEPLPSPGFLGEPSHAELAPFLASPSDASAPIPPTAGPSYPSIRGHSLSYASLTYPSGGRSLALPCLAVPVRVPKPMPGLTHSPACDRCTRLGLRLAIPGPVARAHGRCPTASGPSARSLFAQ